MTTTEENIGTGSLMAQGLKPGMAGGMSAISGTWQLEPSLIIVNYDPSGVLPATCGSDIAYDIGTGSFLMAIGGVNSMDWRALAST